MKIHQISFFYLPLILSVTAHLKIQSPFDVSLPYIFSFFGNPLHSDECHKEEDKLLLTQITDIVDIDYTEQTDQILSLAK